MRTKWIEGQKLQPWLPQSMGSKHGYAVCSWCVCTCNVYSTVHFAKLKKEWVNKERTFYVSPTEDGEIVGVETVSSYLQKM